MLAMRKVYTAANRIKALPSNTVQFWSPLSSAAMLETPNLLLNVLTHCEMFSAATRSALPEHLALTCMSQKNFLGLWVFVLLGLHTWEPVLNN